GNSENLGRPSYSFDLEGDLVVELLESLEVPSAHLVGLSFGAEIALRIAEREPERVKRLVLISPASLSDEFESFFAVDPTTGAGFGNAIELMFHDPPPIPRILHPLLAGTVGRRMA